VTGRARAPRPAADARDRAGGTARQRAGREHPGVQAVEPAAPRLSYAGRGVHGSVVRELGGRIVAGWVAPGDGLPTEPQLGRQLGVSRTVVREALRVLAAKGLVVARPMLGTRVRPASDWHAMDPDVLAWRVAASGEANVLGELREVRSIIEPRAARLAAERSGATPDLEAAFGAMAAGVDDDTQFVEADLRFHAAILAATRNVSLGQLYGAIEASLRLGRAVQVRGARDAGRRRAGAVTLHATLLDAIRACDGAAAEAAMTTILHHAAQDAAAARTDGKGG
jgi:GntR family galactonate operon transcriptional repressor